MSDRRPTTAELNTPGVIYRPDFDPSQLRTVDEPPAGGTPSAEVLTEYGQLMSGGGYHTRNPRPEIERVYPLKEWVEHHRRFGGKVFRRRVIVVEDWTEVTEP